MITTTVGSSQRTRIHPHKFLLWVTMASIIMMFAGLTSAYIVRSNQENWLHFHMPSIFISSTVVILASSLTIHLALKAFKAREMRRYRVLISITALLGVAFAIMQFIGFSYLGAHGIQLLGHGSNPAASFLVIIVGLHVLHVLGGVVALMIIFFKAFNKKVKLYSPLQVELASIYWHFVDILWLYLFVFLYLMH